MEVLQRRSCLRTVGLMYPQQEVFLCGGTSHSNLFGLVQVIRYTGRQASKQHLLHRTLSKHAKFRKFGFGVEDIGSFPENEHAEHAQSRARLWLLHDMCESTCRC